MNIVDSSGWIEFFADGPSAWRFQDPLQEVGALLVPSITIFEVFKVLLRERGENDALQGVSAMQRGVIADLTPKLALSAAKLSHDLNLPLADSIILATAKAYQATIWTLDAHFDRLPGVKYFPKKTG